MANPLLTAGYGKKGVMTILTNMTKWAYVIANGGNDMKALSLAEAKAHFSEVVTDAEHKHERVLIEKRSKPVAVVIGYEDYKRLEEMEDIYESRLLEASLKKGRGSIVSKLSGVISPEKTSKHKEEHTDYLVKKYR